MTLRRNLAAPLFAVYCLFLFVLLLFPFHPSPPITKNGAFFSVPQNALVFQTPGLVKAVSDLETFYSKVTQTNQLTLELLISAESLTNTGPARILTSSNGFHHRNFTVGQEEQGLVIRLRTSKGSSRKKKSQIDVPDVFRPGKIQYLAFSYKSELQQIVVDGERRFTGDPMNGNFSTWNFNFPLLLGNESIGLRPWLGKIYHVAIYDHAFTDALMLQRYSQLHSGKLNPQKIRDWSRASRRIPGLVGLLSLSSGKTPEAGNIGNNRPEIQLEVPPRVPVRKASFLELPKPRTIHGQIRLLIDIVLNIVLFVPMGYLLSILGDSRLKSDLHRFVLIGSSGLIITLSVEIFQYFLEARYSQWTDVAANFTGTILGIAAYCGTRQHFRNRRTHSN